LCRFLVHFDSWCFWLGETQDLVALAAANANAADDEEWHQDEKEKKRGSCSGGTFRGILEIVVAQVAQVYVRIQFIITHGLV
jgi:hypothetical protein